MTARPFSARPPLPLTAPRRRFALWQALAVCGAIFAAGGAAGDLPLAGRDPAAPGSRITAVFQGLRGSDGCLRVSVYNRPDGFPSGAPVAEKRVLLQAANAKTAPGMVTVTFAGLPPGTYAVCAFHDHSGSGRMAQNLLGMPQEEWGMSGNPRARFRAPRFEQASFGLGIREAKVVTIRLHK